MVTLKPCPFCGSDAAITSDDGRFCVFCQGLECYCCVGEAYDAHAMPKHIFHTEEAAAAAWNTRAESVPAHDGRPVGYLCAGQYFWTHEMMEHVPPEHRHEYVPLYAVPPFAAHKYDHSAPEVKASQNSAERSPKSDPAVAGAETLRDPFIGVVAALAAAISLLERTPKAKKAAPSDKMFDQMILDYKRALEAGRKCVSAQEYRPSNDGERKP